VILLQPVDIRAGGAMNDQLRAVVS